jgi:hypothetical protein
MTGPDGRSVGEGDEKSHRRFRVAALAVVVAIPLLATACGSNSASTATSTTSSGSSSATTTSGGGAAAATNVRELQEDLAKVGCYSGQIDGALGPVTKQAIRNFQSAAGLSADGVYGPNTQARLLADAKTGTKVCSSSGPTTPTTKPASTTTTQPSPTTTSIASTTTTPASSTTRPSVAPCTSAAISVALASGQQLESYQCSNGWAAGAQTNSQYASAFLLQSSNGTWIQAPADACSNAAALGIPAAILAVSYCKVS